MLAAVAQRHLARGDRHRLNRRPRGWVKTAARMGVGPDVLSPAGTACSVRNDKASNRLVGGGRFARPVPGQGAS